MGDYRRDTAVWFILVLHVKEIYHAFKIPLYFFHEALTLIQHHVIINIKINSILLLSREVEGMAR